MTSAKDRGGNPVLCKIHFRKETSMRRKDIVPEGSSVNNEATDDLGAAALEQSEALADAAPDPFDPASLRLSQDFSASIGVKKAVLTVPVRKPDRTWFVRVHPDPEYRDQFAVIVLKQDRELYLLATSDWPELSTEPTFKPKLLATAINRQGVIFLWEVNLPRPDGRADELSRTSLESLNLASKQWVRVVANMSLGGYEVFTAAGELSEPIWPDLSFRELLKIAFKDRFIKDASHPVLRRLRGEV